MNTDEPAAGPDIPDERVLLYVVQDIPGRAEEDDDPVLLELLVGETAGILGCLDPEPVGRPDALQRRDSCGNRLVGVAQVTAEQEHAKRRLPAPAGRCIPAPE